MNIEETKAAIAVMQAYVDGKDIEVAGTVPGCPAEDDQWEPMGPCKPAWDWWRAEIGIM